MNLFANIEDPKPKKKKIKEEDFSKIMGKNVPYDNRTVQDVVVSASKRGKINPSFLMSSAWQEGFNQSVNSPDFVSEAYQNASKKDKSLSEYPIDGFYNYGLDTFGNNLDKLKGYLPEGFDKNYRLYDALNEKKEAVKTAAFRNNEDALVAKAAFLNYMRDQVKDYGKQQGLEFDDRTADYFTLSSYNGGFGNAKKVINQYGKAKDKTKFIDEGQSSLKQIHNNIYPRLKRQENINTLFTKNTDMKNGGAVKGAKKATFGDMVGPASVKPPKMKINRNFLDEMPQEIPKIGQGGPQLQTVPGQEDPIYWKPNSDIFGTATPSFNPNFGPEMGEDMEHIDPADGTISVEDQSQNRRGISAATIGLGLQMLNEFIPSDRIRNPVVRPKLVYNERSGGTGSQAIYEDGGDVGAAATDIQLFDGDAKPISTNNFLGDTFEFKGPAHEQGGINIGFGGKKIEVEGGETAFVDRSGTLQIMGNMVIPGSRQKFKNAIKTIAKEEEKMNKKKSLADDLLKGLNATDPIDRLAIAAAGVNKHAADKVHVHLAAKKTSLANLQKAILDEAERVNADPKKVAKGQARKGASLSGEDPDAKIAKKFEDLRQETIRRVQALYPGKKVDVVMNRERDVRTQRALKGRGASQTSVSVHNFGGASDFTIKVDGKVLSGSKKDGTLAVYKNTLQKAAREMGMYNVGDWDPYHISLVQEGKGKTWSTLFSQYPELKQTKRYQDTMGYLKQMVDNGQADADELRTYNFLTGSKSKAKPKTYSSYKEFVAPDNKSGKWIGENFFQDDPANPGQFTPFGSGTPGNPGSAGTGTPKKKKSGVAPIYEGDFDITAPLDKPKTSNVERLKMTQVLPELVSQVTNTTDPVWLQQFTPEYLQPFQITLQDQLNENNATFRGLEKMIDDPAVLSLLQGQTQQNNQKVLGEQFRVNQANEAGVVNSNTNTFNDALMKNLGLADQQYVRQSTAKSKTRSQNNEILNSLAAKELQHSTSMRKLAAWENMYDYRLTDSDNDGIADTLDYQGPDANFDFQGMGTTTTPKKNTQTVTLDQFGVPVRTQRKTEDVVPDTRINISKKGENGASVSSLYSSLMKKFR